MKSELWITEKQTEDLLMSFRVKNTLHEEITDFQQLAVVDTYAYGRMLMLDNIVMTTIKDEFVYHEMLSLVPLNTHPNPENVLVIGGGDGGAVREIVRHPKVKQVTLVEIDEKVIVNSKKYLPEIAAAFDNPKLRLIVADGIKHIQENHNKYDVILVDSTDPIGPAVGLFALDFYRDVYAALKEDGIMAAQTESPYLHDKIIKQIHSDLKSLYPLVKLYLASIPTYPTGLWSFTLASKKHDPLLVKQDDIQDMPTRYYNSKIHFSAFALPNFLANILE